MEINEIIIMILTMVFVTNIVLTDGLGVCPTISYNKKKAIPVGIIVTTAMIIVNLIIYPIQNFLINPYEIEYLEALIYVPIVFFVGWALNNIMERVAPKAKNDLGCSFKLITGNCAVLGLTLMIFESNSGLLEVIATSLGAGLGFTFALILFSAAKIKIESEPLIPEAFKGAPIQLFALGIIALIFSTMAQVIQGLLQLFFV